MRQESKNSAQSSVFGVVVIAAALLAIAGCGTTDEARQTDQPADDDAAAYRLDRDNVLVRDGIAWTLPESWRVRPAVESDPPNSTVVRGPSGAEIVLTVRRGIVSFNNERAREYLTYLYPESERRGEADGENALDTVRRTFKRGTVPVPVRTVRDEETGTLRTTAMFGVAGRLVSVSAFGESSDDPDVDTIVKAMLRALRPVEHIGRMRSRGTYTFAAGATGWRLLYDTPTGSVFRRRRTDTFTDVAVVVEAISGTTAPERDLSGVVNTILDTVHARETGAEAPEDGTAAGASDETERETFQHDLPIGGVSVAFQCVDAVVPGGQIVACVGEGVEKRYRIVAITQAVGDGSPTATVTPIIDEVTSLFVGNLTFPREGGAE